MQKHKVIKRIMALILTAVFTVSCIGTAYASDAGSDMAKGEPWIDSDLFDCISESDNIRLQDDFAAAANKEWILNEGSKLKKENMIHIMDIVNDKKVALLTDGSLSGKEAEELQKFGDLASDWDYREKNGVDPIRPYLDSIDAISNMDEFYAWINDPQKNPLGVAPVAVQMMISRLRAYPDEVMVAYGAPDLSLGREGSYYSMLGSPLERKEQVDQKVTYILSKLGYEKKEINRILKQNYAMEKKLARIVSPVDTDENSQEKNTDSIEDLIAAAGAYPFKDYLKARGYEGVKHMLGDKRYLKKISRLCKEKNLDGFKSMMKVSYILKLGYYLDRDTYDAFTQISKPKTIKETTDFRTDAEKDRDLLCEDIAESGMSAAMDKVYLEKYISDKAVEELRQLTDDVIATYRNEIFPNEDWLSEEGKAACIEKLDAITKNVVYPDLSAVDYSSLDIVSKEEGGTYLEAYLDSMIFLEKMKGERAGKKYDPKQWYPYESQISTTATNSVYVPEANSINIYAGMLEDPAYHEGMSREELLSGIGAIIGHEITHGFDSNGVKYDKDGIRNQWLPLKDQQEFSDRARRISSYFSELKPYKGSGTYTSAQVTGEATADMGGLKAMLMLASKEKDFDMDAFFRHYASLWAAQRDMESEKWYFKNDEHPLSFYRINVNVQQFEEFYKTYDIKPGDKMYLEPKNRVSVW